jgi:ABC-2 type transport system ATP-binding protein
VTINAAATLNSVRDDACGVPAGGEIVRVRDLVKVYPGGTVPAVNGLDFAVRPGEIFGLLGPNGAGKTTAISIICTLLRPTSGSVVLSGHDVVTEPAAVRGLLGLAPQDLALYPSLTVGENLRYFGRLHGLKGRSLDRRIAECLEMVGLAESGARRVDSCSGGMKRRANLAVAMLHAPQVLVLDEPTVGIDAQSRNTIMENLAALRDGGMTIIYTTHYMEEAESLCSRVAIMDNGRIISEGAPEDLIGQAQQCTNLEELFLRLTGKHLRD